MNRTSVPNLPASVPDAASEAVSRPMVELAAPSLYAVWAAVALLADASGAASLPAGAGLTLGLGSALTCGLFLFLGRLPVPEQPGGATLTAAQSLMGILWASLYCWFAGTTAAGALLGMGMYLSAIGLAMSTAELPVLGRLMLVSVIASGVVYVLQQATLPGLGDQPDVGILLTALLPRIATCVLLATFYLVARRFSTHGTLLEARNTELLAGIERIRRHAERDQLTNSYSRQSILELVARERARADRSGEALCLCLLDIDHFKNMNDRYGHIAGDRILAAFGRRVRGALRTMDTLNSGGLPVSITANTTEPALGGRSAFGRIGGEEFIVLLPETSLRGALRCAERVRKAVVRRPFDGLHQVTVSIGIAEYRPGESVSSLIGRADEALYGAKNAGRNRVHAATADGGPSAIIMPDIPAVS